MVMDVHMKIMKRMLIIIELYIYGIILGRDDDKLSQQLDKDKHVTSTSRKL